MCTGVMPVWALDCPHSTMILGHEHFCTRIQCMLLRIHSMLYSMGTLRYVDPLS